MNNPMGAMGENIQGVLSTDFSIGVYTPTPVLLRNAAGQLNLLQVDRLTQATLTVGKLGVGTLTPAAKLEVNGGIYVDGSQSGYGGGEVTLNGGAGTENVISTLATGAPLMNFDHRGTGNTGLWRWRNGTGAATELMRLTAAGQLGIGVVATAAPLHVMYAAANSTTTVPVLQLDNPSGGTQTGLAFAHNGTVHGLIRVGSGGNVAINATAGAAVILGFTDLGAAANTNVTGLVTVYNNIATEGYGLPAVVSRVGLTAQGADIADTNLDNAGVVGEYIVYVYVFTTTTDGTAGTATVNMKWNDGASARTQSFSISLAGSSYNTQVIPLRLGSGNITYGVTHSGSYATAKYGLYISGHRVN